MAKAKKSAASTARADVLDDLDAIKADLGQFQTDLSGLLHDLVSAGKAESGEVKARVEAAIRDRLERLGDAIEGLQERGRERVEDLRGHIEERPLTSVAIAFGAGLVFGNLFSRR